VLAEVEGIVLVYMNRIVRIAFVPKLSLQTNAQLRFPSDSTSATLSQRYPIIESVFTLSHSNRLSVMQIHWHVSSTMANLCATSQHAAGCEEETAKLAGMCCKQAVKSSSMSF
jgi:hypothetical protein